LSSSHDYGHPVIYFVSLKIAVIYLIQPSLKLKNKGSLFQNFKDGMILVDFELCGHELKYQNLGIEN
jgi:hypothetical protein